MLENFMAHSTNPWLLSASIVALAWLWEDAALISGALLAVEGRLGVPVAVLAIFVGICSGDLALYLVGRAGHRVRGLRAWMLTNPRSRELQRRFRRSTLLNILLIRFIPGLRTLGFSLCGLWRIGLRRFTVAMGIAGIIWIAVIFTAIYALGGSSWLVNSHWKWSLMGFALVLLVANNIVARRSLARVRVKKP